MTNHIIFLQSQLWKFTGVKNLLDSNIFQFKLQELFIKTFMSSNARNDSWSLNFHNLSTKICSYFEPFYNLLTSNIISLFKFSPSNYNPWTSNLHPFQKLFYLVQTIRIYMVNLLSSKSLSLKTPNNYLWNLNW